MTTAAFDPFQDDDNEANPRFSSDSFIGKEQTTLESNSPLPEDPFLAFNSPDPFKQQPYVQESALGSDIFVTKTTTIASPTLPSLSDDPFVTPVTADGTKIYDPFAQPSSTKNTTPQNTDGMTPESKVPSFSFEESKGKRDSSEVFASPSDISGTNSFSDSNSSENSASDDEGEKVLQDDRLRAMYDTSGLDGECMMRRCARFASKEWKPCYFRIHKNQLQLFRTKSHIQRFLDLERAQRQDKDAYCKLRFDIMHYHKCTSIKCKEYRLRKDTTTGSADSQSPNSEARSARLTNFSLQRIDQDKRVNLVRFASAEESVIQDLRSHLNRVICRARYLIRCPNAE